MRFWMACAEPVVRGMSEVGVRWRIGEARRRQRRKESLRRKWSISRDVVSVDHFRLNDDAMKWWISSVREKRSERASSMVMKGTVSWDMPSGKLGGGADLLIGRGEP